MRKTKIQFTLDAADIAKAVREIEDYKKSVMKRFNKLMNALVEAGAIEAKEQLVINAMDIWDGYETGMLRDSIYGVYDPQTHVGFIRAGEGCQVDWDYPFNYAFAVQYGTGLMGANNPHPDRNAPLGYDGVWEYDVNGHGEAGWVYHIEGEKRYHHTWGRPAIPFMYYTTKELKGICKKLAKEVFR